MKCLIRAAIIFATLSQPLVAAASSLEGDWTTPDHSVVTVYPCAAGALCIRIIQPADIAAKDEKNPDPRLRTQPICGLQIGKGFVNVDASHAKGGTIYDPDSGNTYKAKIEADQSQMKVRGYVGASFFGRTEVWHRPQQKIAPCVR